MKRSANLVPIEEQIEIALYMATSAHEGQFRKFGDDKDKPYIVHPSRVADALYGSDKIVGYLHDVLEDTDVGEEDLFLMGISQVYIDAVKALSKKGGESYYEFIQRIIHTKGEVGEIAVRVKIADIEDNLKSLQDGNLKQKYLFARKLLSYNIKPNHIIEKKDIMKILILEDSDERIRKFNENLNKDGISVTFTKFVEPCIDILKKEVFDYLFLDHDLGGEVYVESGGDKETGYDVAKWLSENTDRMPKNIILHSLNEAGRENMQSLLPDAKQIPFAWMHMIAK
jgi:CheY-like chemotaxis protein